MGLSLTHTVIVCAHKYLSWLSPHSSSALTVRACVCMCVCCGSVLLTHTHTHRCLCICYILVYFALVLDHILPPDIIFRARLFPKSQNNQPQLLQYIFVFVPANTYIYIRIYTHTWVFVISDKNCLRAFCCSYLPLVLLLLHDYQLTHTHTCCSHTHTKSLLHIHKYIKDKKKRLQFDLPTVAQCPHTHTLLQTVSRSRLSMQLKITVEILIDY